MSYESEIRDTVDRIRECESDIETARFRGNQEAETYFRNKIVQLRDELEYYQSK